MEICLTQERQELRRWWKPEQLRCQLIEDSAGRHSLVAPGTIFGCNFKLVGNNKPQGRSSGSHRTRPQSSRSLSCTCWQEEYTYRWGSRWWAAPLKVDENHLSQVNVSSGQEERVRDMKELGDGAGSLPHTLASDPEKKFTIFTLICLRKFFTHLPIEAAKGITLKYNFIMSTMWFSMV